MMYTELIQASLNNTLNKDLPYVLWDFPDYANPGDSAIWLGQVHSLKYFFQRDPVNVTEPVTDCRLLPAISKHTQIILQGGGNFGDLWPNIQAFRELILTTFPNNRIVQMPQSIHFESAHNFKQAQQICSSHPDFHIMVRDQPSFELSVRLNNGRTTLVPDFALSLTNLYPNHKPTVPIYALLRTDKEKSVNIDQINNFNILFDDWIEDEPNWPEKSFLSFLNKLFRRSPPFFRPFISRLKLLVFNLLATRRLNRAVNYLSNGQVIITDRLHAHILCSLMQIPNIFLDNSYGKLSNFRSSWQTGDPSFCCQASSLDDAYLKALSFLNKF